jgi:predicted glycosyltransferase
VLHAGVPAVCVPRAEPRVEQLVRARTFAERGLLRLVEPAELSAVRLRAEIAAALRTDRVALAARIRGMVDFGGAGRAAAELLQLAPTRAGTVREPAGVRS